MIDLQHISKVYPVGKEKFYALRDVNLHIQAGEFVAICGASGSGKSTLLNIVGCLDTPSEGTYFLEGEDVASLSSERQAAIRNEKIGFVLQDFALIDNESVLYNVMLPLLLSKTPLSDIKRRAYEVLGLVGIADQAKKKANNLSGGQRQRVAIARAIVNMPSIILADEPTGQLDSQTGIQIMEILKVLNQQGITVLLVTHDEQVAAYATRRIVVVDGNISG
jgi:putative ABC transport system ATP-binding protein